MTGLLGGGHAIYFDAAPGRREPRLLRRGPGLGADRAVSCWSSRCRSARSSSTTRSACVLRRARPAGRARRLWRAHGRLPGTRSSSRRCGSRATGVDVAAGARGVSRDARAGDDDARGRAIYAPGGRLLETATGSSSPASSPRSSSIAAEGAARVYSGTIAEALLELSTERGGLSPTRPRAPTRRLVASPSRRATRARAC